MAEVDGGLVVPLIALNSGTPYCLAIGLMAMNTELEHTPVRRSTFSERMTVAGLLGALVGLGLGIAPDDLDRPAEHPAGGVDLVLRDLHRLAGGMGEPAAGARDASDVADLDARRVRRAEHAADREQRGRERNAESYRSLHVHPLLVTAIQSISDENSCAW